MTINIEGFNEMAITDLHPVYPTDFSTTTLRLFSREEDPNMFKCLAESFTLVYEVFRQAPVELPFVSRSSLYFLIWKGVNWRGSGTRQEKMQEDSWKRKIDIWRKYTRLQHQVAQATGVAAYFFLQPNQYLKGSKPFSDKKRAIAIRSEISEVRHAEMTLLREAALDMRAQRLPVFDLTQIYRQTLEPVYRDACCHVVELGNEIMAEQIVARSARCFRRRPEGLEAPASAVLARSYPAADHLGSTSTKALGSVLSQHVEAGQQQLPAQPAWA